MFHEPHAEKLLQSPMVHCDEPGFSQHLRSFVSIVAKKYMSLPGLVVSLILPPEVTCYVNRFRGLKPFLHSWNRSFLLIMYYF